MRRLDVLTWSLVLLGAGGLAYFGLNGLGIESGQAGVWTSAALMVGLLGWLATYLGRVFTGNMALKAQNQAYKIDALQNQLDKMSPQELAELAEELKVPFENSD